MVGSLTYAFATARLVGLAVKLAYGFTLSLRFPSEVSQPLNASVTFWEASAPLKLPTRYCLRLGRIRYTKCQGWYLTGDRSLPPILNMNILYINIKL